MSFSFRQTIQTARASKGDNVFAGKSTLRADEKAKDERQQPKDTALQAYLAKKYTCGDLAQEGTEGKRKKKKKPSSAQETIRIVDRDVSGFQAVDPSAQRALLKRGPLDVDDEGEEDAPTIANPEEAASLLKQVDKAKSGAGWVTATDAEPSHGKRHDSPDASPPRRGQRRDSPDASPPRRGQRHDSPDASPPRRGQRHDSPDASPPRRGQRRDSPDASPPRRGQRHDSPSVLPPQGAKRAQSPDTSLPRRRQRLNSGEPSLARDRPANMPVPRPVTELGRRAGMALATGAGTAPSGPNAPNRMGDGTAAGLVSAEQLLEDIQRQRELAEERRRNAEGRGAGTVYRDKATGRIMTPEEALKAKEDERAARKKPSMYDEDQTLEWRAGLAQKREAEERKRARQEEAAKPFAHSDVDNAHDAALRDVVRFGDPFAHLARKKKASAADTVAALTERYDVDKLNKSGFKIPQEVPPHSWLKRGVAAPANRYNIRPGRHWDGVDRSNGFEKQLFAHQNTRAAKELEARLWSMGDM